MGSLHESYGNKGRYAYIVAGISCGQARLSTSGYIWRVEVLPQYRGRGYGKEMMLFVIEEAKKAGHPWVRVRVHLNNAPARAMYLSLGFSERIFRAGVDMGGDVVAVTGRDARGPWVELEFEIDG